MHEAKLAYRPLPHDDWGFIRTESGDLFATVRRPLDNDEAAAHRAAGTDPFEPLALALIQAVQAEGEPDPERTCITCLQPLEEHDPAYYSEDGIMHALCCGPGRESFYNADELPLVEGEPIPRPFFWSASPKRGMPIVDDPTNDRLCVDRFAIAMRSKLIDAGEKGRRGWDNPEECGPDALSRMLREHVEKGDPVDVANFAMMLHQRGLRIVPADKSDERVAAINRHFQLVRDRIDQILGPKTTDISAPVDDMAAALEAPDDGRPAPPRITTKKEETSVEQAFSGWAIVELMGHRTRPGRVKEVEMAGSKMLQVDIPVSDVDFVSEFYSAPALYSIRPCTEEIAREKANYSYLDPRPVRPLDYRPREAIEDERHRGHQEDGETGPAY